MPGLRFLRVATFLSLAAVLSTGALHAQDEETVEWFGDYKQALAEAKRTGKPIFLEFRCEP
jgi:hypothetical protein